MTLRVALTIDGNAQGATQAAGEAARGLQGVDAAAKQTQRDLNDASKSSQNFGQSLVTGINAPAANATKHIGLARHELINFSRQAQDAGVSLASGQSPFIVLVQQGTQIADIFASTNGTVRGFLSQVASAITPMRLLAGGVAAAGAAVVIANAYWKEHALRLDDAARAAGTTIAQFRGLENSAAIKGISDFEQASQNFAANLYQARNNMGSLAELFRANNKQAGDFVESLARVADLVRNAGDYQRQVQVTQQAGLPGTIQWVRYLGQGGDAIRKNASEAQGFGSRADSDMIQKAREFDEAWNRGWLRFKGAAFEATNSAKGWIDDLIERAERFRREGGITGAMLKLVPGYQSPEQRRGVVGPSDAWTDRRPLMLQDVHGAMGYAPNPTRDSAALRQQLALEQQRIAILGQTATIADVVKQKENEINLARLNHVSISETEEATLKRLAKEQALGITVIKAQADAYDVEAAAIGMSTGQAVAHSAAQSVLNEHKRNGRKLSDEQTAAIYREAEAMGQAAQRSEDLRWGYENLVRGPLQTLRSEIANGSTAFEALRAAGVRALENISSKLMDMASRELWSAAFPSSKGGGGFSLASLLGGNSGAAGAATSSYMMGSTVVPVFHSGRQPGVPPREWRSVDPQVFAAAPSFHKGRSPWFAAGELPAIIKDDEWVIPDEKVRRAGRGSGGGDTYNDNRTFNDVTPDVMARLEARLRQEKPLWIKEALRAMQSQRQVNPYAYSPG